MPTKSSPSKSTPYHHGDLHRTLLDAAVVAIAKRNIDSFSLRDLARDVGVSHGAPYHHFIDKRALLAAIAAEGYNKLSDVMRAAFGVPTDSFVAKIEHMAYAYVDFATKMPVHLHLMFGPEFADRDKNSEVLAASEQLHAFIYSIVAQGQADCAMAQSDILIQTAAAWSMIHGLALLLSNSRLRDRGYAIALKKKIPG